MKHMRFPALFKVFGLARRAYRAYTKEILILAGFGFLSGILEGIGINAVIPLLSFIVEGSAPATDAISSGIRSLFGFLGVDFAPKFLLGFIVLLFCGKAVIALILNYIQSRITADYMARTRRAVFRASSRASWRHLIGQKSGYLETIAMVDVPAATNMLLLLSTMVTMVTGLVIYLVVAFNISPPVTLATFTLGATIVIVFSPLMHWVRSLSGKRASLNREATHDIGEALAGIKIIKAFDVEEKAEARVAELFERIKRLAIRIQFFQTAAVLVVPPIGILYIALIFGLAFRTHFISLAALPAIVYLIYRISLYIQQLQSSLQAVSEYTPHLSAVLGFEQGARANEERDHGKKPFAFEGELRFDTVSFSYTDAPMLDEVSFSIKKGAMVGIIGPSGAGKTTTVDLLLRLLAPSTGSITLDGTLVGDITLASWRKNVCYVSQDVFTMRGSIRENIAFYRDVSDEEIMKAAQKAHIDAFIKKSPQGLDTAIGDRGVTLSAGERQRLSIARALVGDPEILVLDEATSALDSESEKHIQDVIAGLKGKMTIVVIAHRLSTIMDSDQLIAFDKGRVVETGTPTELLKDKDSYFFKVRSIQ